LSASGLRRNWPNAFTAVLSSSTFTGGSSLVMMKLGLQEGALPLPPRLHSESPNGSRSLNAKYARRK